MKPLGCIQQNPESGKLHQTYYLASILLAEKMQKEERETVDLRDFRDILEKL